MFQFFKNRKIRRTQAHAIYDGIAVQARQQAFYESMGVPDTVDGRFEMIALHCYIVMHRLNKAGDKKLSQTLFNVFFRTMEKNLREMGIGDLGVPKHMKRMMQGFNGRANHYETALREGNISELKQALVKNVYGTVESPNSAGVNKLATYVDASAKMDNLVADFAPLTMKSKNEGELKSA